MAEKVLNKTKAHQSYRKSDGTRVPGVTTVLGVLAKPALIAWANRMGLQGIDTRAYVDAKAEVGTCAHYLIECELRGEKPDLSEFAPISVDAAENGYLKFLSWRDGQPGFKWVASELQLVSEEHGYGGTVDILCEIDGKLTLLDIKTSGSGIWPEMKHQVAAYRQLCIENNYPVEQAVIIRVGRDDGEGFETATISDMDKHLDLFLHCLAVYRLQKELA